MQEHNIPSHPMDAIEVRPIQFDFDEIRNSNPVWSQSCPDFSIFINALGIHVPHFEQFLVQVMRRHRQELDNPALLQDVKAIIGQESHHAFNFTKWTKQRSSHYPGLAEIDRSAKAYFEQLFQRRDKKFQIGFTAGYETFTFLGGMIILNRYEELMADADENLRALWVWHQVEEVEHGAVAFDFYQAFYGQHEGYRRYMVGYAFLHISLETFKAYRVMLKGSRFTLKRRVLAWKFFFSFAWDLFAASLPVYRKGYHPRHHPICNQAQNPIATAWRQYHASGQNVKILNQNTMQSLTQ